MGTETEKQKAGSRWRRWWRLALMDTQPLRQRREFRLLFVAQAGSSFGTRITYVAIPYQVFRLTHSPLAVGLLGLAELAPLLATALIGGALADAHDRRRLVRLTELGMASASALLLVNAALPHPRLWVLYAASVLLAAMDGLQTPSLDALVPRLVAREELPAAVALEATRGTLGMVAGPALGGVLVAAAGLPAAYGVDVVSFGFSLLLLSRMRAVPPPPGAPRVSLRGVLEGLRYARSRPELLGTYVVDIVAMLFGMPLALFPAIAERYGGAGVLGLLYAAPATGALLANLTSGWLGRSRRHGAGILGAAGFWGLAITAFGVAFGAGGPLWLALLLLGAAGAADMVSGLFRSTIWNQTIPDELRGRLGGIELLSYSIGPTLGNVEAGAVASAFTVTASVVSGGLLCVAGVGVCALLLPAFRRYDSVAFMALTRANPTNPRSGAH